MSFNENYHKNIINKLNFFIENKKIPNLLFHGPSGAGKRTIVFNFLKNIYKNNPLMDEYILFVNCAQGKGIKFIREDLKFFAKTNINFENGNIFKSIVLSNADKLTIDAQSALRRCIEQFSHNTRFFIIIEDKDKLLKPILSRFSEILIPFPIINGKETNLNSLKTISNETINYEEKKKNFIKKNLIKCSNVSDLVKFSEKLYNKAITGDDLIEYLKSQKNSKNKIKLITAANKAKLEIKGEELIILFILNLIFRSDTDLENILEM
tara:strand:+ start:111 stop:908 length:798 start_codon:yes stop_codon:yes gene_type:complete